jgi:hypothetical protein
MRMRLATGVRAGSEIDSAVVLRGAQRVGLLEQTERDCAH